MNERGEETEERTRVDMGVIYHERVMIGWGVVVGGTGSLSWHAKENGQQIYTNQRVGTLHQT